MKKFALLSQKQKSFLIQLSITICVSFTSVGCGTSLSWTSPALPHLKSNNSKVPITEFEGSWIASTLDLGGVVGNLLNPAISPFMGRKYCLAFSTILQVISWLFVIIDKNVTILYASRFINGLANSIGLNFAIMYIGEIAEKNTRGILLLILRISLQTGSLIVLIFGAYLPYNLMNLGVLLMPLLYIITFPFIPESPYYLLLHEKIEEAQNSVIKLKGTNNSEIIDEELFRINNSTLKAKETERCAMWDLFYSKGNRKAFFVLILLQANKVLSGRFAIAAYTQEIFDYTGFLLSSKNSAILYTSVTLVMIVIASQFIERIGRRKIVLYSSLFSGIGLTIVGLFFFIKFYLNGDIQSITWLPLFGLIVYNIASTLGVGSLTYVITGEIFSLHVKVTAVMCSAIVTDLMVFLVKLSFQWMNCNVGIYTTFWIYSICSYVGGIVFFFYAPETKGKTLEEIQDILNDNNNSGRKLEKKSNSFLWTETY
ncbi:facilitated trehalose transporter Tret1-like [Leptopilina heterotoma]|uniref:facilitated trehalose transporter Tret1-like n=1 Tax=Leptopilina heterotoma TaxID=63436 RepID=UPI001CA8ACDC|nr:facilitated trehalose transporter Tret1-like [Leptopilina heterotoma]